MAVATLRTERLILRPWTSADISALHGMLSDPRTMEFWSRPFDMEQSQAWLDRSIALYDAKGYGRWAVELGDSGVIAGDCGLLDLQLDGRPEVDLGYIIHHPYWRRGYGVEAARAILHYALDELGIERVVANMAEEHVGSARVAERIGMRLERTFRNPRNRDLPTMVWVATRG